MEPPFDTNTEKAAPVPKPSLQPITLLSLLILVLQVLIALIAYPFLPPIVPSHWNAAGEVDGFQPKWLFLSLFPAISIGTYALIQILMRISPRLNNQSQKPNLQIANLIVVAILLLFLIIELTTIAIALHYPIEINFVISLALSVMIIFIGNYLGKLRRNFWAGIRTPWTLASEAVWERTHRVGGWLFVLGGLAGIIMSFFPPLRIWGIMIAIGIPAIASVAYSYVIYQRLTINGKEPLSPPFDNSGDTGA